MSVVTLRQAIDNRAREIIAPALVAAGVMHHKKGWRNCPCSWCEKKREATLVIGSHVPKFVSGHYVEDMRDAWRDDKRRQYRKQLNILENES